ncbi:hypothetical protein [Microvirga sp. CF3016]|nr:hypothetical protein [Microvirga sp. CF3016]MEE1610894.1 hypothetical protein [Microvirga sp. CF3016]
MKRRPEDFVDYLFRFLVIASGVLTAILLVSALARLLEADAGGLGQQP